MTKKLLSPIRVLSPILRAGKYPTLRRLIRRSAAPVPQITDQMIVEGHGFLRSLCLALSDNLLHDRSNDPELFILEIDVLPLKRKQFTLSQSRCHIRQGHDSFPRTERRQQLPDLVAGEDVRSGATFGEISHWAGAKPERLTTPTRRQPSLKNCCDCLPEKVGLYVVDGCRSSTTYLELPVMRSLVFSRESAWLPDRQSCGSTRLSLAP
jgi:hypothetical protein